MRRVVGLGFLIAIAAIFGGLIFSHLQQADSSQSSIMQPSPTSKVRFDRWLQQDAGRQTAFAEFQQFLAGKNVDDTVPSWQLTRIDAFYAGKCKIDPFRIPPKELWPNVVPALELIRDRVIPVLGPVSVLSSYRTPELNKCARGASASKHLSFHALDLAAENNRTGEAFYRELCALHQKAGPQSKMGLGAYFDPLRPNYAGGRFHVDGTGFRSWGPDYRAASSPCLMFR